MPTASAHLLIVEDEPAIALALEDDLTLEGYKVTVVHDGLEALKRAARRRSTRFCWTSCCRARTGSRYAASCGAAVCERRS